MLAWGAGGREAGPRAGPGSNCHHPAAPCSLADQDQDQSLGCRADQGRHQYLHCPVDLHACAAALLGVVEPELAQAEDLEGHLVKVPGVPDSVGPKAAAADLATHHVLDPVGPLVEVHGVPDFGVPMAAAAVAAVARVAGRVHLGAVLDGKSLARGRPWGVACHCLAAFPASVDFLPTPAAAALLDFGQAQIASSYGRAHDQVHCLAAGFDASCC